MSISEKTERTGLTKEERAGKGTGDEHVKAEGKLAEKSLKANKERAGKEKEVTKAE